MDPRLIVNNVGYIISTIITLATISFAFFRGPKKILTLTFALMSLGLVVFEISHLIGINTTDSVFSRQVLMWNLCNIFIVAFNAHWALALIGKVRERIYPLIAVYVSGVALFVFYLINPNTFLLTSVPKMYFPNYYVPGSLYWLMRVYFVLVSAYFIYELIRAYFATTDFFERNKYKYVLSGLIFGYIVGSTALFLVFDIQIDPLWSMFVGLYTVPFVYAMINYELMDIKVVAKRALVYAVSVGLLSGVISLISFSNAWLSARFPNFPLELLPVVASIAAVGIGFFVWLKIKETDLLKYEFVTVVTHKFRTPLTSIKWSADMLKSAKLSDDADSNVATISQSADELVELTNLLINLGDSENPKYLYNFKRIPFSSFFEGVVDIYSHRFAEKKIEFVFERNQSEAQGSFDSIRVKFIIQTLLDNALAYTPANGKVSLRLDFEKGNAVFSVSDNGIGVPEDESRHIFSKFFRAKNAKLADTEGVGIGLFMAKIIATRHGGKLWFESKGAGHGATFYLSLPIKG